MNSSDEDFNELSEYYAEASEDNYWKGMMRYTDICPI